MALAKRQKRGTITFDPDDDVADGLEKIQEALGHARGIRSEIINSALRAELPGIIQRKVDALSRLTLTDQSEHQSRGQPPSTAFHEQRPERSDRVRKRPKPQ